MSRSGYSRGTLARQARKEEAQVQAGVSKQQFGCAWVAACAVIVLLALLALIAVKPMSREQASRSASSDVNAAPLNAVIPQDVRECAYAGDCYSWGGTPQAWHKTIIAPILALAAVITFVGILAKLMR